MVQRSREPRLAQEAPTETLVVRELAHEHFESDPTAASRVLGQVDGSHCALADLRIDAKARQDRAGTNVGRHRSY